MTDLVYPVKSFDIYDGEQTDDELDELYGLGYRAAIDYYSWTDGKNLTHDSAVRHTKHNMWTGVVWEADGATFNGFGSQKGKEAAMQSVVLARQVGQPEQSGIAFAVDFGPSPGVIAQYIMPYFGMVASYVRSAGYIVGCYGCGDVLTALYHAGLIDYDWLAGALGWPGSRNYVSPIPGQNGRPAITQGLEAKPNGIDIDPDMVYKAGILFQVTE